MLELLLLHSICERSLQTKFEIKFKSEIQIRNKNRKKEKWYMRAWADFPVLADSTTSVARPNSLNVALACGPGRSTSRRARMWHRRVEATVSHSLRVCVSGWVAGQWVLVSSLPPSNGLPVHGSVAVANSMPRGSGSWDFGVLSTRG
jgi:hypothetical protein